MILVIAGKICARQSFTTNRGTLSKPGALLEGMAIITLRTSAQDTGWNSNCSASA